ncbi:MAG: COQ9 family protein [Alphaproteobacteria bacterium]|nr:COQ9 family protein [Alphaproteobacteria bacterium]
MATGHLAAERRAILDKTLGHVPFDGWSERSLRQGAADAGFDDAMWRRAFPGGPAAAIEFWSAETDRAMVAALADQDITALKIRERIAAAVRWRLEALAPHREAARRALSHLSQPQYAGLGLRCLYRTVDEMWHAAGDTATDFNFYSKRGLLAGVFTSTVLFWLDDASEDNEATWSFLDRRIADAMRLPKVSERLRKIPAGIPRPRRVVRRVREHLREGERS